MRSVLRFSPLAAYWALFFAGMGLMFPFNALYLSEGAGLSSSQVGLVLAVPPAVGLLAQPLWGQLADRTGARTILLVVLGGGSSLALLLFSRLVGFVPILLGLGLVAVFQTAVVPSLTAVTLATLGPRQRYFGIIRAFGTAGFAVLVLGFPVLLELVAPASAATDGRERLAVLYVVAAALNLLAALVGLTLPRRGEVSRRAGRGEWRALLGHRAYRRVLVVFFLAFFALHGPMVLFPVYLRELGGGVGAVSRAWAYMLVLEIPLVILAPLGLRRVDARALLALGVLAGGLRWTTCAFVDTLSVAYPVQLLHAVTVAGLLTGGPLYVEAVVPQGLRSTGQALLSMVGAGVGGILSSVAAGWAIDAAGVRAPYLVGGIAALGLLALLPWLPAPRRPSEAGVATPAP